MLKSKITETKSDDPVKHAACEYYIKSVEEKKKIIEMKQL